MAVVKIRAGRRGARRFIHLAEPTFVFLCCVEKKNGTHDDDFIRDARLFLRGD